MQKISPFRILLMLFSLYFYPLQATSNDDQDQTRIDEFLCTIENQSFKDLKKKIYNHIKNSWCSEQKVDLTMDTIALIRPEVCVEIGSFTGSMTLSIAATLKHLRHGKLIAIDAWSNEEAIKGLDSNDPNYSWWKSVDMKLTKKIFDNTIHQWGLGPYCNVIILRSEDAIHAIEEEIDFLLIDGNFSEQGSLQDVQLYLPKLKQGGYVLLSNLFLETKGHLPKMNTLWLLMDHCEVVCEIENSNTVLFRKN